MAYSVTPAPRQGRRACETHRPATDRSNIDTTLPPTRPHTVAHRVACRHRSLSLIKSTIDKISPDDLRRGPTGSCSPIFSTLAHNLLPAPILQLLVLRGLAVNAHEFKHSPLRALRAEELATWALEVMRDHSHFVSLILGCGVHAPDTTTSHVHHDHDHDHDEEGDPSSSSGEPSLGSLSVKPNFFPLLRGLVNTQVRLTLMSFISVRMGRPGYRQNLVFEIGVLTFE